MEQKEIGSATAFLMIFVALIYDLFQLIINLIPIAGQILSFVITIFAFLTFYLWFKIYGRSFVSPKRAMAMGAGVIIEIIPIISILPGWTVAVILLIGIEKLEKITSLVPGGNKLFKGGKITNDKN